MQILKKSERYSKSTGYRLGAFEGMFDSEYQAWSSARIIGKEQEVANWFKLNPRCAGCIIAWDQDEYQKIRRVTTYGDMPTDAIRDLEQWGIQNRSPYSNSWYDTNGIDWDYKPEGSLRLSDHWGWETEGERHCELADAPGYQVGWRLAVRKDGKYHTVKVYPLDTETK